MLERRLHRVAAMWKIRAGGVAATCLLAACSRAAPPPAAITTRPLTPGYVTIVPDVSVSRNAQPAKPRQATLDPHADVMAEILAIPPGH
jgi:hypothetical protein